ncbi:sulfatase-like hydrolase/transferase [Rhodococcus hoagii]|nr:sulfatase-like hydrolase/transferase [Prescottella equi]
MLVILLDDMGFGASSAFGGPCSMPVAEQLAADGLRFNRFHTTAICSPTRAALLTGRNHHSVGMGVVTDFSSSAPGYTGVRPLDAAPLARTLREKRLTRPACSASGTRSRRTRSLPSARSRTGRLGRASTPLRDHRGADDQFHPTCTPAPRRWSRRRRRAGLSPLRGPRRQDQDWIRSVRDVDKDRPWFAYLPFGATHSPSRFRIRGGTGTAGSSATAGTRNVSRPSSGRRSWGVVPPARSCRPGPTVPRTGTSSTTTVASSRNGSWRCTRRSPSTPDEQVGRLVEFSPRRRGAREHGGLLHPGRQTARPARDA